MIMVRSAAGPGQSGRNGHADTPTGRRIYWARPFHQAMLAIAGTALAIGQEQRPCADLRGCAEQHRFEILR